jgi:hypothetical protein
MFRETQAPGDSNLVFDVIPSGASLTGGSPPFHGLRICHIRSFIRFRFKLRLNHKLKFKLVLKLRIG